VGVERRPVHRRIARPAAPGDAFDAVPEARLMTHEDSVRAEGVPMRAANGWLGNPLPAPVVERDTSRIRDKVVLSATGQFRAQNWCYGKVALHV
jgi:hypothetical protein